jgi:hypothetical protein
MKRRILHRRTLLKGAGHGLLAAVALPSLEAMLNGNGTAYADGTPIPLRFGMWYWGSGVRRERFFPRTTGPNWEVTDELAPLQGVRSEFNVLGGFSVREGGIVHHIGTAVLKTGRGYIDHGGHFNTDVRARSFDIDVAQHLGADTAFPALHVGVYSDGRFNGEGLNTRALSHNGYFGGNIRTPGVDHARTCRRHTSRTRTCATEHDDVHPKTLNSYVTQASLRSREP